MALRHLHYTVFKVLCIHVPGLHHGSCWKNCAVMLWDTFRTSAVGTTKGLINKSSQDMINFREFIRPKIRVMGVHGSRPTVAIPPLQHCQCASYPKRPRPQLLLHR